MEFVLPQEDLYGLVPLFTDVNRFQCQQFIEQCGRTCYKSEDKITDDSCVRFTSNILNRRHLTVIEHSNLVIKIRIADDRKQMINILRQFKSDFMVYDYDDLFVYLAGNLRAWMEMLDVYDFERIVTESMRCVQDNLVNYDVFVATENQEIPSTLMRYTVKFTHDRAFSHELVRHRLCVFSQESQRYVRYDVEGGARFIVPYQYRGGDMPTRFIDFVRGCELEYRHQREVEGHPPELARTCLPNCTKTEVVTTADKIEWDHIFTLRHHNAAHPDMRGAMGRIINPVQGAFQF